LGELATVLNSTFARLEAAFADQKNFTADASHELRTPLAVILTETQRVLSRERTAAEYREAIEICREAAQEMKRLTESLLELARFDAGQETLRRQPFDLAVVAQAAVDLMRPLAVERNIKVEVACAPASASGDPDRLRQVAVNLLQNAVRYNRDGGEIRVTTSATEHEAVLTVSDTGGGIAAEALPHVFERFYRADKARSRAQGGTGLGLAICKAIVAAHGGSIAIESEVGKGTTLTVRLPRG
ncbi:MAG TPA: ATP-binding protein, partial [Opitutaceae bacterium]